MRLSQTQLYWQERRKIADANLTFLEMLKGDRPITNAELEQLIEKRPELWGRFSGFLGKLTD